MGRFKFSFNKLKLPKDKSKTPKPKPREPEILDVTGTKVRPQKFLPPPKAEIEVFQMRSDLMMARERALRMARCGDSIQEIADSLKCTAKEAFDVLKSALIEFAPQLSRAALQIKEMDLMKLDELEGRLWKELEPDIMLVPNGPEGYREIRIIGNNCAQVAGIRTKNPLSVAVAKMILDVQKRRADLLGLDSAKKMEVETNVFVREYVGVDPDAL